MLERWVESGRALCPTRKVLDCWQQPEGLLVVLVGAGLRWGTCCGEVGVWLLCSGRVVGSGWVCTTHTHTLVACRCSLVLACGEGDEVLEGRLFWRDVLAAVHRVTL